MGNVEQIKGIITELEGVNEKAIQAKTNYNNSLEDLEGLGHFSVEDAKDALAATDREITKRTEKLAEDFKQMTEEFPHVFS